MPADSPAPTSSDWRPPSAASIAVRLLGVLAILGLLLFLPAGRLDWVEAWVAHRGMRHPPASGDAVSACLALLWQEVAASKEAQAILASNCPMAPGSRPNPWAGKPSYMPAAGCSPFTPKHVTAIWVLSVLGDVGFTVQDGRIRKARVRPRVPMARWAVQPGQVPLILSVVQLAHRRASRSRTSRMNSPERRTTTSGWPGW